MKRLVKTPIIAVIIFLSLSLSLLLDEPFVWPDEALYGDVARNIAADGRPGTDLLKGLITGIESHAYWVPPLFMYILGGWIKIFGTSLVTQKLMSVFLSVIVLVIFYQITKYFINTKNIFLGQILSLVTIFLLAADSTFLKASRLSRPESLVLAFTLGAMFFYCKSLLSTSKKQQLFLLIAGLLVGLALISHLIAVCFALAFGIHLLYCRQTKIIKAKSVLIFVLALVSPVLVWLISIFPNYNLLINQLNIISQSRNYTIPWYVNVLAFPLLLKLSYLIYGAISLMFLIFTLKNRQPLYVLLSLILIATWIFVTLGEIFWYTVLPLPFVYLALLIFANHILNQPLRNFIPKVFIAVIFTAFITADFSNYSELFNKYRYNNAYIKFTSQINENVPANKTVFLTSIPDAYFAFSEGRNRLYEYPAFFANPDDFKKLLDQTDYIVFSSFFSPDPISRLLDQYITKNTESITQLSSPYQVMIIKLRSRNSRTELP